jgi:hypothetical protein
MRRSLVIVAIVALVAVVTGTTALASGASVSSGSHERFSVLGTITALEDDTITTQVSEGSRLVQPYIGLALTVQITPTTLYYRWTPYGLVSITYSDVKVDDTANVHGTVAGDDDFTATRVTILP